MDVTVDAPPGEEDAQGSAHAGAPGLVVLMDAACAAARPFALPRNGLLLGRGAPDGCFATDGWVSRSHVRVRRVAGCWSIEDQGSRNGTSVNGQALANAATLQGSPIVRLGRSLGWAVEDIAPFTQGALQADLDGPVLGAALRRAWREIEVASRASDSLLIGGPSGAGKELAARAFHRACYGDDPGAPFVAVNCATIPLGVAERLLFGSRRGAYSGAQDAQGFVQAAHGGTLFLDELAELEPAVQAKLLRVLENGEVTPLGASQPRPVRIRVCGATLRDLREEVRAGRFREDLYYRIGRPAVHVPALRDRLDELPFLATRTLAAVDPRLTPTVDLVEQCALRPWPGNVRELVGELRHAGHAALEAGSTQVEARFLAPDAGQELRTGAAPDPSAKATLPSQGQSPSARPAAPWPADRVIRDALEREGGNVSAAARALGLHRNQLRRWLARQTDGPEGY